MVFSAGYNRMTARARSCPVSRRRWICRWAARRAGAEPGARANRIRLGYAPARNWTLSATLFLNKLNVSGLSNVAIQSGSLFKRDEDYRHVQFDFGVKY